MIRCTQTLLSAFDFIFKREDGWDDFLLTLNREKKPPTQAMLDGVAFESAVNGVLDGFPVSKDNPLAEQINWCADYLNGSQKQVTLYKAINLDGEQICLHGVLDFLKAGTIYDTKFSKTYSVGKYYTSPQTPMYFALVPEAKRFEYVVCDGKYVYRESYTPDEVTPIETHIRHFIRFVKERGLWDTYKEKWRMDDGIH